MGNSNFITFFVLLAAQCGLWSTTESLQLNLTESCANTQIVYCTLSNITATLSDPLTVVNATAPQLYELVLRDSLISRIPTALIALAPALRSLFMHNCGLNRITTFDFPTNHSLRTLVLQKNRFFDVPENAFVAIYELEQLQLARNMIHMVHQNAFNGLEKLRYLDLQQNDIRELPKSLFDDLVNLEHIDLSRNCIEKIDVTTFHRNLKLQTLLLGDNRFSLFEPNSLEHLPRLHLLDISNSLVNELRVQSVDTLLVQASTLQYIAIAGSAIKVHAGNNQLTSLNITDKLSVRELDLHGNRLESLEDLVGMLNLQRLDVSRNQLQSLRTSHSPLYLPLPNLVHLNLASNQLQNQTLESFLVLQKLTHLDLGFNHLLHLDQRLFEPLVNLEKFYIEGNRLHTFDYEQLVAKHEYLKEFGIFENEWDYRYMRTMLAYLKEHNIQIPVRFTSNNNNGNNNAGNLFGSTLNTLSSGDKVTHHRYASTASSIDDSDERLAEIAAPAIANITGINQYWTTRDVLTLIILLLVLLILFLQLFSVLREEECLPSCCNGIARNAQSNARRRLEEEEEDSEV
ncbi:PREDICTED: leucine-rich repeats and immunoglobulin-like domains protein sma-10 [Rhagoletis zephyria]|uniref:leucine-rich repeats and immunoglobulin-like domains protein sma-10 n=1 Tax=Rhagoletis zephyria TaxID=28612 RepID=UPI0008115617|nr:PREDICTED: leucine-rich repeats and immunoglobulin-like domains protein sma-10 [Rhagoletis zephyria]